MSLSNDFYYVVKHMIEEALYSRDREIQGLKDRLRDTDEEVDRLRERVRELEASHSPDPDPSSAEA